MSEENVNLAKEVLRGPRGGDLTDTSNYPQYRNSPHKGQMLESGLPGLHRFEFADTTVCGVKNESPIHNMAALMLARGMANTEVAAAAGFTPEYIAVLKSQHWFQQRIAWHSANITADITERLKAEANGAFERIVNLSQEAPSEDVKASTILAANVFLVEQVTGKATQKILSISKTTHYESPADEMADLQSQLKALESTRLSPPAELVLGITNSPDDSAPSPSPSVAHPTDTTKPNGTESSS